MIKFIISIFKIIFGLTISIVLFPFLILDKIINTTSKINKKVSFNNKRNIYNLSKEDIRIAKEERMTLDEYIEAEENDDDNLDNDN